MKGNSCIFLPANFVNAWKSRLHKNCFIICESKKLTIVTHFGVMPRLMNVLGYLVLSIDNLRLEYIKT